MPRFEYRDRSNCEQDCELKGALNNSKELENRFFPTILNNIGYSLPGQNGCIQNNRCVPEELVKNGSFETTGISGFANWTFSANDIDLFPRSEPYEGRTSAAFETVDTDAVTDKIANIRQIVIVPQGCYLSLSFADNFNTAGTGIISFSFSATVSYFDNGNEVNIINIDNNYSPIQSGKGFTFHQKVSDKPLPSNINNVILQFTIRIKDKGNVNTQWFLDGVSLRAV